MRLVFGVLISLVFITIPTALGGSSSSRFEILHSTLDGGGGTSSTGLHTIESSLEQLGGSSLSTNGRVSLAQGEVGVLNDPPLPQKDFFELPLTGPLSLSVSNLLANDLDREGNPLAFSINDTNTTRGGTVTLSNGTILYTPPSGSSGGDSFSYTVTDIFGSSSTGTVVLFSEASAPKLIDLQTVNRNITIYFRGSPDGYFLLQFRPDFNATSFWHDFPENQPSMVQADTTGNFQFTVPIGSAQGFYRTVDVNSLKNETSITRTASQLYMTFRGSPHAIYRLQFRPTLEVNNSWIDYPNSSQPFTVRTDDDGTCSLSAPMSAGNGFFRLTVQSN